MMITAVYFQARPGVVFSVLLGPACVPRTGTRVKFGAEVPGPAPLLTGQTKTPARLLGLSGGS